MARITDREIDAAQARGKREHNTEPRAVSVKYDRTSGRFIIALASGTEVAIPATLLQGMAGATIADRSKVNVQGAGYGLHWPTLDLDFSVPGLLADVFGTTAFMAKRAGQAKSKAKAVAARRNGQKGGRPRKVKAA
jgi:Protein of unknown function (DUF2442)